jgi:hypothetical protein
MESLATLKHHRKSDNMYRFGFGVQTVTVTRRFLPSRAVRVRVTCETVSGKGEGNWSEYRDFTDMHDGDRAYSKQAAQWCAKWEERYLAPKTKETPMTDEPTQEPTPETDTDRQPTATHWAGGATMTPAKAAELATRRTGVQHVVGEDGHTLCRRPAPAGPPAVIEHAVPAGAPVTLNRRGVDFVADTAPAGKILGEYVFRVRGDRPTRTGEMGRLLTGSAVVATEARTALVAHANTGLTGHAETDEERTRYVMDLQAHTFYFTALLDAGYKATTTWDELVALLQPLLAQAREALPQGRMELTTGEDDAQRLRETVAAALFLKATEGVRYFFEDPEDGA